MDLVTADHRHILVIHPGALGDVLEAVPALRTLGESGRVTFCGQPRLGALLSGARVVAEAVSFDSFGLEELFTGEPVSATLAARLGHFERIVSWFGSSDARYPERLRTFAPTCVVASPVPGRDSPITVWRHLRATLGDVSPPTVDELAPLVLPEAWRNRARDILDEIGARRDKALLVVHPGAGGQWKVPATEVLARAIAARGDDIQVLVHAGPADREAAERFARAVDAPVLFLVEPALPELAGVLAMTQAYLGGDSGVSHLAAAVGARAIVLFPAATLSQWAPWSATAHPIAMEPDADAAASRAASALGAAISASRRSCP